MRTLLISTLVLLTAVGLAVSQTGAGGDDAPAAAVRAPALSHDGTVDVPPFGVGERLTFEIGYGFVDAGTAVLGIPELVEHQGRSCYRILSVAESNSFISSFFHVRDVAESYLDARDLVSRRFEKSLREGNYRAHDLVEFDHERQIAIYPDRSEIIPLAAEAQDILSSLYTVRMMDLEVGRSVFIENHADRKNYPLEILVVKKERVSVPAGRFDCIVVEPRMRGAGLFSHKGRLWVWLTDDDLHLPVQMRSKVVIGSISAELAAYTLADGATIE